MASLSTEPNNKIANAIRYILLVTVFVVMAIIGKSYETPQIRQAIKETNTIFTYLMDARKGEALKWLIELCDDYGPRMAGSSNLEKAERFAINVLKKDGFKVHTEPVKSLKWIRGNDKATIIEPRQQELGILALGGSTSGTVQAEVVVLEKATDLGNANVKGKIVLFNYKFISYGKHKGLRYVANEIAEKGGVGLLVSSITGYSLYSPHAGQGAYNGSNIPSGCITTEEAAMIGRWAARGKKVVIRMDFKSHLVGELTTNTIVFDLVGSKLPNEVIAFVCHFDSWDVGQGALDDGGGCAAIREAMLGLKALSEVDPKFKPKRTIRGIFMGADEEGLLGAKQYFAAHSKKNEEKFVFLLETDAGAFKPLNWNSNLSVTAKANEFKKIEQITKFINKQNVPLKAVNYTGSQAQVDGFAKAGIPVANYDSDRAEKYYFNYHHTYADYVNIFEAGDLETVSAIIATLGHHLSQMKSWTEF